MYCQKDNLHIISLLSIKNNQPHHFQVIKKLSRKTTLSILFEQGSTEGPVTGKNHCLLNPGAPANQRKSIYIFCGCLDQQGK